MQNEPVKNAILKRRTTRKFTDRAVTDAEIEELLEAARWAPSWANTQVWEYIIVRDKGLMEQVISTYSEHNPGTKGSLAASILIIPCAKTGVSGELKGYPPSKFHEWFMFDLGLSVQNLSLRAYELGLGTVVVGAIDHDACAKVLKLPDGYVPIAVLPIGEPFTKDKKGPARKEIAEFTHLNAFGNSWK